MTQRFGLQKKLNDKEPSLMTVLEIMKGDQDIMKNSRSSKKSYSADKLFPLVFH